ncbi:MAG: sigma-54-dependent Fis family transcriptional regulator [Deltaproteobacteria bacterium]|nr:sigma-54-dependent Fis family transcriptional regulator [Deltaproteobacteria bacterium]
MQKRNTASDRSEHLVLLADDDETLRALLERWLTRAGFGVRTFASGEALMLGLTSHLPSTVLLDLNMPGAGGMATLRTLQKRYPRLPVTILTAQDDAKTAVEALRAGAYDYLAKPADRTRVVSTVRRSCEHHQIRQTLHSLEREVEGQGYEGLVGEAPATKALFRKIDRVAPSDVTVLVRGESGSGKELVARSLHSAGSRSSGSFVALNCAAIPENLQESELFGHEKGAFTGATSQRIGRFEEADGGTLFLDEVAELSLRLQAKLLRVLQERSFRRVGGQSEITPDFRLVTASHRDLLAEVRSGRFREDLYYRLAVFELTVPPLRERRGDIALLASTFLARFGEAEGRNLRLSEDARAALEAHPFPGNVRELMNAMQRAAILADDVIGLEHLPPRMLEAQALGPSSRSRPSRVVPSHAEVTHDLTKTEQSLTDSEQNLRPRTLEEIERAAIEAALARNEGNLSAVVRELGIGRTTLYRKLDRYGLR